MKPRGIIFDLDGTLLDTLQDIAIAANYALTTVGAEVLPIEAFRKLIGRGGIWLMKEILGPEDPARIERATQLLQDYYAKNSDVHTKPYSGIISVLDRLASDRITLAVASNKTDRVAKSAVRKFFPTIPFRTTQGLQEGRPAKPNPAIAIDVANQCGLLPREFCFVGDTEIDIETGTRAGMETVGVLWGFRDESDLLQTDSGYLAHSPQNLLDWWGC